MRILLVEDHIDTATIFGRFLSQYGLFISTAYNLEEARESCRSQTFDLVLCDLRLPDGDGSTFIRELHQTCDTPAIAISAHCFPDDVERSLKAGFSMHVKKPVAMDELLDAIEQVTSRRPAIPPAGSPFDLPPAHQ